MHPNGTAYGAEHKKHYTSIPHMAIRVRCVRKVPNGACFSARVRNVGLQRTTEHAHIARNLFIMLFYCHVSYGRLTYG